MMFKGVSRLFNLQYVVAFVNIAVMAYAFMSYLHPSEVVVMASCLACLLVAYAIGRQVAHRLGGPDEIKRRSWVLSFLGATILTIICLPNLFALLSSSGAQFSHIVNDDSSTARFSVIFFSVVMLLDLLIGAVDYPTHLQLTSGLCHHTFFLWCGAAVLHFRMCGYFLGISSVEIPTLILAVGSFYKPFRMDLPYGFLLFLFRIAYTVWYMAMVALFSGSTMLTVFLCVSLVFNASWFYMWASGYMKKVSTASITVSRSKTGGVGEA